MNIEELNEKYREKYFKDNDFVKLCNIKVINFDPHPYMVGPEHVQRAADTNGGILDETILKEVGCVHPGCTLSYEEHKYKTVMFLQLKRDISDTEISEFVLSIKEEMLEDRIDGLGFVETEELFRVTKDEQKDNEYNQDAPVSGQ